MYNEQIEFLHFLSMDNKKKRYKVEALSVKASIDYRIAGYFRGVYISWTANSILVREK